MGHRLQIHEGLRGPRPGSLPAFRWDPGHKEPGTFTSPVGTERPPARHPRPFQGPGEGLVEAHPPSVPPPPGVPLGEPRGAWGAAGLGVALSDSLASRVKTSVGFRGAFRGRESFQKVGNDDTCGLWGGGWNRPHPPLSPAGHLPGKAAAAGSAVAAPSGLQGEEKEAAEPQPRGLEDNRDPAVPACRPQAGTGVTVLSSEAHLCLPRVERALVWTALCPWARCLAV